MLRNWSAASCCWTWRIAVALWSLLSVAAASAAADGNARLAHWRQDGRSLLARWDYNDTALDDPSQRAALMALYSSSNGPAWFVPAASNNSVSVPWGAAGSSYCR